jgi:hypothetical protein
MIRTVPNSHSFGSLENILITYKFQPEELTKEYLLIGFKNTLEREYELEIIDENKLREFNTNSLVFAKIGGILYYLESKDYDYENFIEGIKNTIASGVDLKCKRKMERHEVYKRIDTERDYQDLCWTPRREINGISDEEKPPAEWINYMEYHIAKAKEEVYFLHNEEVLAHIRKVAALAVRCLELHGCPERIIPEELLEQKDA